MYYYLLFMFKNLIVSLHLIILKLSHFIVQKCRIFFAGYFHMYYKIK